MKTVSKLFTAAAIAFAAVACQVIDEGQIVTRQLEVTATIAEDEASKVDYAIDNNENTISPTWHINDTPDDTPDQIIGFDNNGNTFTFTVSSVSDDGKYATFSYDDTKYTPPIEGTLYAIYAPGVEENAIDEENKTLDINLLSQYGVLDGRAPVLMCATATIEDSKVNFQFTNQTAIIGVKQFKLNGVSAATTVTSMTLNGVVTKGTFSVDGESGKLTLTPTGSAASITANGSWETNNSGICNTSVYFAAIPTDDATLSLDAYTESSKFIRVSFIENKDLEAGKYYYTSRVLEKVVAKVTVGETSTEYLTINAAFEAADASTEACTITLLADCSASDQLTLGSSSGSGKITLDLNGNELTTIASNNGISVESGRELTIDDSSSNGTIRNNTNGEYYVIYNTGGTTTIKGGNIVSNYRPLRNDESGEVNIKGGTLESTAEVTTNSYAIYNAANLSISGGSIIAKRFPVFNTTTSGYATITGGTFYSSSNTSNVAAVRGYNGTVEISGGYFSMNYSDGELFTVYSGKVYVSGGYFDRALSSTFTTYMSGDKNYASANYLNTTSSTKGKYPFRVGAYTRTFNVVKEGSSTQYWHRTAESAAKQASDATVNTTISPRSNQTLSNALTLTNPNNTITLDLKGYTITTSVASFITTSGKLIITDNSENKGGIITSDNNNVITVNGSDADVKISNCKITTSYDGGESSTYGYRTIYHNGGKITITDAEIEATDASAIYSSNGEITIDNTIITSKYYGLYGGTSTNVTIKGDNTSFYSDAYRCVWANTATTLVTINSGYFYSKGDNNAVTCASVAKANFTFTGGFFSKVGTLTGSTGYNKIKDVTGVTHTHNDTYKYLSYPKGYVTDEIPGTTEEVVVSLGTAISNGITF